MSRVSGCHVWLWLPEFATGCAFLAHPVLGCRETERIAPVFSGLNPSRQGRQCLATAHGLAEKQAAGSGDTWGLVEPQFNGAQEKSRGASHSMHSFRADVWKGSWLNKMALDSPWNIGLTTQPSRVLCCKEKTHAWPREIWLQALV